IAGNMVSMFFKNDRSLARAKRLYLEAQDETKRGALIEELKQDSLVKSFYDMLSETKDNLIILSPLTYGLSEAGLLQALTQKLEAQTQLKVIFIGLGDISPRVLNLASKHRDRFAIMSVPEEVLRDGP